MKKIVCMVVAALFMSGCGSGGGKKTFSSIADLEGAKIGILQGSMLRDAMDKQSPRYTPVYFDKLMDVLTALKTSKIDATLIDRPMADFIIRHNPDIVALPGSLPGGRSGFAIAKGSSLAEKANPVLERLVRDGAIQKLIDDWGAADESGRPAQALDHKPDFDGSAGTLKFACDVITPPACYTASDGRIMGLDVDIANLIAYELNMKTDVSSMLFHGLLPAVASGKVDMAGSLMYMTEERMETVDFVDPYLESDILVMVRKDRLGK